MLLLFRLRQLVPLPHLPVDHQGPLPLGPVDHQ